MAVNVLTTVSINTIILQRSREHIMMPLDKSCPNVLLFLIHFYWWTELYIPIFIGKFTRVRLYSQRIKIFNFLCNIGDFYAELILRYTNWRTVTIVCGALTRLQITQTNSCWTRMNNCYCISTRTGIVAIDLC